MGEHRDWRVRGAGVEEHVGRGHAEAVDDVVVRDHQGPAPGLGEEPATAERHARSDLHHAVDDALVKGAKIGGARSGGGRSGDGRGRSAVLRVHLRRGDEREEQDGDGSDAHDGREGSRRRPP